MAEGFSPRPPTLHADGIYLDLPMWAYLRDPAIGGHGAKTLAASAPDWRWERPDNALWREPESDARTLGTLIHKAVLEGWDAFEEAYCVRPNREDHPDAVETAEEIREWLRPHKERDPKGVKLTGAKGDLIEQALAIAARDGLTFKTWDAVVAEIAGDREMISPESGRYVRLTEAFARNAYGWLLDGGLSEVSVFFTIDGVRHKARFDRMTPRRLVDLKKFGQPPKLGHSLRQHLVNEAARLGYPIQAVMHMRAARAAAERLDEDGFEIHASGAGVMERIKRCADILHAWREEEPLFTWLFLRCPGPFVGKPIPFRPSDPMFVKAEQTIDEAVDNFRRFTDACGDELWMDAQDEEEIDDSDWPLWAFRSPMEDRGL